MMKSITLSAFYLSIFLLLVKCYPDDPDSNQDYKTVIQAYNPEFSLSESRSFAFYESIFEFKDSLAEKDVALTSVDYFALSDRVRTNLLSANWIDSTNGSDPELLVLISLKTGYYFNSEWAVWDWLNNLTGFSYSNSTSRPSWFSDDLPYINDFSPGTLILHIIDAKALSTNMGGEMPVVWVGVLNDLVWDKEHIDETLLSIDRLFQLSPIKN